MKKHLQQDHSCEDCGTLRPANSALFGGPQLGRRDFFKIAGTGVAGYMLSPVFAKQVKAQDYPPHLNGRARNVIFIHMDGAPSHTDTFDLKVGSWTPADFTPDSYNGIVFPKGLMPNIYANLKNIAIVRSLRAPALVHGLQQTWKQIARNPTSLLGKVAPNIGAVVAREFESQRQPNQKLPGFISLNGGNVVQSGYFNAKYTPFAVTASTNGLGGLTNNFAGQTDFEKRYQLLQDLDAENRVDSPLGDPVMDMDGFYQQGRSMMYNTEVDAVFKFSTTDANRYGVNNAQTGFGNSCRTAFQLLKDNLGTRYVQINIGGWDNHTGIYATNAGIYPSARQFDSGVGQLLNDLAATPGFNGSSMLDETLVVWMGEFGRTVRTGTGTAGLNGNAGRDHFFQHFVCFAGGGVSGGRAIGETTSDGFAVTNPGWSQGRPVANEDIAATIY
ncbi:MAG: DUF1501 domain-containing protein, partial [Blastocatellia bacterium]